MTTHDQSSQQSQPTEEPPLLERLDQLLDELRGTIRDTEDVHEAFRRLLREGFGNLPWPGEGETWLRWQALARVADVDLSLCKLLEGHTDALAICREMNAPLPDRAQYSWATWAAEAPHARVELSQPDEQGLVRLSGTKAWCSGARVVTHALVTAWNAEGKRQLTAVELDQPGVEVTDRGWTAIGMHDTGSVEVVFDDARAHVIGPSDEYLARPGFWHGGAGVAACWYGGIQKLAEALRAACQRRQEPHALAHLGAVDAALTAAGTALRACAGWIDRHPRLNAELAARRVRAICEDSGAAVMDHVGRALGAGPYCQDAEMARLLADLPVFLRQSHAERDLEVIGRKVLVLPAGSWKL